VSLVTAVTKMSPVAVEQLKQLFERTTSSRVPSGDHAGLSPRAAG
jgi:hypothetical protein